MNSNPEWRVVPLKQLQEARDMLEHWSSYVPAYFAEKHGLKDDFVTLDKWIAASIEVLVEVADIHPTQGGSE